MQLKIEPDTQEAREEIYMAVAMKIDGPPPKDYSLPPNKRIELKFHPDIPRAVVTVSFDGAIVYAPYLDTFEKAIADTRSGIKVTLLDDSAPPDPDVAKE